VSIRSICSSAAAALGIACSSGAFARTVFVHAAYVPTTVVYVPPYPVYAPAPAYVVPSVTVIAPVMQVPVPDAAVPIPLPIPVPVAVPAATAPGYAIVPAQNVAYAQPVLAVPATTAR
jgi:hypothetical protein